jgi:hypothetical protein
MFGGGNDPVRGRAHMYCMYIVHEFWRTWRVAMRVASSTALGAVPVGSLRICARAHKQSEAPRMGVSFSVVPESGP